MIEDRLRRHLEDQARAFNTPQRVPLKVLRRARTRMILSGIIAMFSLSAVLASGFIVANTLASNDSPQTPALAPPSSKESESTGSPAGPPRSGFFVPPTEERNGKVIMPLTFPDGSTTELHYPEDLGLAELGVTGGATAVSSFGENGNDSECIWEIHISYGDPRGSYYKGEQPIQEYEGTHIPVELWKGVDGSRFSLVFRFKSWIAVMLCDAAPPNQGEDAWFRKIDGEQTPEGFLVLRSHDPLELAPPGERGGPALNIGTDNARVHVVPGSCEVGRDAQPIGDKGVELFPGGAYWCAKEHEIKITAYGNNEFLDRLIEGLEVKNTSLVSE